MSASSSSVGGCGDATRPVCRLVPRNPDLDVIMRKLLDRDRVLSMTYGVGGSPDLSPVAQETVRFATPIFFGVLVLKPGVEINIPRDWGAVFGQSGFEFCSSFAG